jgi:hypothetical protein
MVENKTLWMGTLFVIFCILLSAFGIIKADSDKDKRIAKELVLNTKLTILETKQVNIEKDIVDTTEKTKDYTNYKYAQALDNTYGAINKTKEQLISMIPKSQVYVTTAYCLLNNNSDGIISLECKKE